MKENFLDFGSWRVCYSISSYSVTSAHNASFSVFQLNTPTFSVFSELSLYLYFEVFDF